MVRLNRMFTEYCNNIKKLNFVEEIKLNLFWGVEYLYFGGVDCFSYSERKIRTLGQNFNYL